MASKEKLHLYNPQDIVRSVLLGVSVKAECGKSKVHTREEVNAVKDSGMKICHACHDSVGAVAVGGTNVTIQGADGWTAILERAWLYLDASRFQPVTYSFSSGTTRNWDIPPAA